jgi:hypothetical protein
VAAPPKADKVRSAGPVSVVGPMKPGRKSAKARRQATDGSAHGDPTVGGAGAAVGQAGTAGVAPTQVIAAELEAGATAADAPKPGAERSKRVKLNLSYIAPLSVAKISFLISVAMGIAMVVAIYILWEVLNNNEVFTQIDEMIKAVVGESRPKELNILQYVEAGRIMSGAAIIAVINVVVLTLLSTLLAVIYNIIAALVGGVRVTLKER